VKIALDAGHGQDNLRFGQYDPGCQDDGYDEADLNLRVALTLKFILTEEGYACYLTRTDKFDSAPLTQRVGKAVAAGCTRYLSIHMNCADGLARGTECYYRSLEDKGWAARVQSAALDGFGLKNRGLKPESDSQHKRLLVFDFPGPCALLETGFMDNSKDRGKILLRENRIEFADQLAAELAKILAEDILVGDSARDRVEES